MIIYQSSKKEFVDNTLNPHDRNRGIADIIRVEFEKRIGKVHDAEYHAWKNSLRHMATVVDTSAIHDDATVCIEYRLPHQNSRIDFIIAGKDCSGNENVVIVELKQWSSVTALADADLVRTVINGGERNVPHPSYQAWSYAITLQEYNECVQNDGVLLYPCAFLHNYAPMHDDPVLNKAIFREFQIFLCADNRTLLQILHKPLPSLHTLMTPATQERFYRIGNLCKYPIRYYHTLAFLSIFYGHSFKQAPCGASEGRGLLRREGGLPTSLQSRSGLLAASALNSERKQKALRKKCFSEGAVKFLLGKRKHSLSEGCPIPGARIKPGQP